MFQTGYIPDVPDDRDKDSSEVLLSVAESLNSNTLDDCVVDVLHQANLGSCVANAGFQAVRMSQVQQLIEKREYDLMSPPPLGARLFGYFNARAYHEATDRDGGTHIRYFFKSLNKFGFCPESVMPYDTSLFAELPDHHVYQAAMDQKDPTDYYRIRETGNDRLDRIRQAIDNRHPVVFGTSVSRDFCKGRGIEGAIPIPTGDIAGGHAMVIEGYQREDYVILNSWGAGFGRRGRVLFSSEYMAWERTRDLWIVKSAPSYSDIPFAEAA